MLPMTAIPTDTTIPDSFAFKRPKLIVFPTAVEKMNRKKTISMPPAIIKAIPNPLCMFGFLSAGECAANWEPSELPLCLESFQIGFKPIRIFARKQKTYGDLPSPTA